LSEASKPTEPMTMTQPGFRERPYLYKEIGYKYEEEIRFVFGTNPDLLKEGPSEDALPGVFIELDWRSLVSGKVEASSEIWKSERDAIGMIIQSLDQEEIRRLKEINKEFDPPGESPFTVSDDPAGLFSDLDLG